MVGGHEETRNAAYGPSETRNGLNQTCCLMSVTHCTHHKQHTHGRNRTGLHAIFLIVYFFVKFYTCKCEVSVGALSALHWSLTDGLSRNMSFTLQAISRVEVEVLFWKRNQYNRLMVSVYGLAVILFPTRRPLQDCLVSAVDN